MDPPQSSVRIFHLDRMSCHSQTCFPGFPPEVLCLSRFGQMPKCVTIAGEPAVCAPTAAHCGTITRGSVPAIEHPSNHGQSCQVVEAATIVARQLPSPMRRKPISFTQSTEDDFVSIFQKFPLLSRRQRNWILAARGLAPTGNPPRGFCPHPTQFRLPADRRARRLHPLLA